MAMVLLAGKALSLGPFPAFPSLLLPWVTPCLAISELRVFTAKLLTWLCPGEKYLCSPDLNLQSMEQWWVPAECHLPLHCPVHPNQALAFDFQPLG